MEERVGSSGQLLHAVVPRMAAKSCLVPSDPSPFPSRSSGLMHFLESPAQQTHWPANPVQHTVLD